MSEMAFRPLDQVSKLTCPRAKPFFPDIQRNNYSKNRRLGRVFNLLKYLNSLKNSGKLRLKMLKSKVFCVKKICELSRKYVRKKSRAFGAHSV